jgi:uncharacterized protein (DUF3820 family)
MKIILFGQRRNGTTMAFQLLRRVSGLRCYYEPLHPKLLNHSQWNGISEIERDEKAVYAEYKTLGARFEKLYCPLGAPVFSIEQEVLQDCWTKKHSRYLKYLLNSSTSVMVQPVRINYHLTRILQDFPEAYFVWIVRSPEGVVSSLMRRHPRMFEMKGKNPFGMVEKRVRFMFESFRIPWLSKMIKDPVVGDYWSQDMMAQCLLKRKDYYSIFKGHPLWFKLMLTWYDSVAAVERFRKALPANQFALIRYESICYDPDNIMDRLCDWLKIERPKQSFRTMVYSEPSYVFKPQDERWKWAKKEIEKVLMDENSDWKFPAKTTIGEFYQHDCF